MANLNKLDFTALEVSRRNYIKWTQDVKRHLTAKKLRATILLDGIAPEEKRANAMIFMRKHMEEALQNEYLGKEDPLALWTALEERSNHQKAIFLPKARNDWQNLRFQDFKTVNEYNSEIFRICSLLKFCGEELTEVDLLKKTFSTFHPSSIVLQQQYREMKFVKFSELITTLLLGEKNNLLIVKNDQARPTGTIARPLPEANVVDIRSPNRNARNHGRQRGPRSYRPRNGRQGPLDNGPYNNVQRGQGPRGQGPRGNCLRGRNPREQNAGRAPPRAPNTGPARPDPAQNGPTVCYRCGSTNHWSRTYHATQQAVNEYHGGRGNREANFVETTFEIADFQAANGNIDD